MFVTETLDTGISRTSKRYREWINSQEVLEKLPLHAHLLLVPEMVTEGVFLTRRFNIPALEGTMATRIPEAPLLPDSLRQIVLGLKAMHALGIIHQQLEPKNLFLARSTLFCSGYRVIIGGFYHSGSVFLHQSPLNPTLPTQQMDLDAFYKLGVLWKVPEWPYLNSLLKYESWLWMRPVSSCFKPSTELLLTLQAYAPKYESVQRMLYVMQCVKAEFRLLNEPYVTTVTPTDADLLAIAVDLKNKAAQYSDGAARFCYRCILELLNLVLWETPEVGKINELRECIASKLL
jgi:hypothetical protein